MDVFEPGPGAQLNDFNPDVAPSGLFWTLAIPPENVQVNLDSGTASFLLNNATVHDYGNIPNALVGGGPVPVPATLSFEVRWGQPRERDMVYNEEQSFIGLFARNKAQMAWSATVGNYEFTSSPLATSSSSFAEVGYELNGIFAPFPILLPTPGEL